MESAKERILKRRSEKGRANYDEYGNLIGITRNFGFDTEITPREANSPSSTTIEATPAAATTDPGTYSWDDFDREYTYEPVAETAGPNNKSKTVISGSGPRGYRNNNPLNIRISNNAWQGKVSNNTDGAFEQFTDMAHGYRAAFLNMRKRIQSGDNTLRKMIEKWAPASDGNRPLQYAQTVAQAAGIGIDDALDPNNKDVMTKIAAAMARVENGADTDMADVVAGWDLLS